MKIVLKLYKIMFLLKNKNSDKKRKLKSELNIILKV